MVATIPSRGWSAPLSMASTACAPVSPSIPRMAPVTWPCTASWPNAKPAIEIAMTISGPSENTE
jgi:hypothetical protein